MPSKIIAALPLLLFLTCHAAMATPDAAPHPDPDTHWRSADPQVFVDGDSLHYYGELNDTGAERLRNVLAQVTTPLSTLHIASPGGDGLASIAIAEQIHARGLAVVVVGEGCASGCANYIFTPAHRRTISPDSLVLWHYSCPDRLPASRRKARSMLRRVYGTPAFSFSASDDDGTTIEDPAQLRERFERSLDRLAESAVAFSRDIRSGHRRVFAGTGIDPRIICLADHIRLPDVPDAMVGYLYTLPVEDMARFGVCDVQARPDYAEWAAHTIDADHDLREGAGVVRLVDHPRFRPRHRSVQCNSAASDAS